MSDNPYQSVPYLPPAASPVAQQKPGGLMAITIICLMLGILGALASIFGLAMLPFQETLSQLQSGQSGTPAADFHAKMAEIQQSQFVPNLVAVGCNLVVGTLLVISSIGVLQTKEWGRNLLRNALLVAAIFVVLRGIYGIWAQYNMLGFMQEMMQSQSDNANPAAIGMQIGLLIGLVVALVWIVGLSGFYLWSRMYLNKPSIKTLFDAGN